MQVYIRSDFSQSDYSDEAVAVYIALRRILRRDEPKYYITINMIYYTLRGTLQNQTYDRYFVDKIKSGLNELINSGLVSCEEVISMSEFILDLTQLELNTKKTSETKHFFTVIEDTEIHTIMNSNNKHKFKLLRYFVFLVSTFNNVSQIGFTPLEYMEDKIKVSKKTLINYNRILEEMKLIYTYRSDMCVRNNETTEIKRITNTYGRYADKDKTIQAGQHYSDEYGYTSDDSKVKLRSSKENRSASAKYNAFIKGKEYDYDTLEEIYLVLHEFNSSLERRYGKGWERYKKDLTVFKEYEFYCEGCT